MSYRRRTTHLDTAAAISRLEQMLHWIEREIEHAIRTEATLEAANNEIVGDLLTVGFDGSSCFAQVQRITMLHLALTVARLYEIPSPQYGKGTLGERRVKKWDKSDIASIPLIVRLLRHADCQEELLARATNWTPSWPERASQNEKDCKRAIEDALAAYAGLYRSMAGRQSVAKLKDFRNEGLAHIRTDALFQNMPKYEDLFRLVDVAKSVVGRAMLAVLGNNDAFTEVEDHAMMQAIEFWRPALSAAHHATRWDRPLES